MGHGSETHDLAVAQSQILAAKRRMEGQDGLQDQGKYMHLYLSELIFGTVFGILLFVSFLLIFVDRQMAVYAAGFTAVIALAHVAVKTRKVITTRKKRAEDLRQLAIEKEKTNETTEANNA
ncbi:hypothetical protein FIV06_21425 [Labrenzia sp. THAF191b]|nr:hypothetical protein FIV06_21425 [Labrenzia sp. THAF191b]QFT06318.1 hypothetical protein FIV05_21420 [Labrenzia sp. THAF191a]QFT17862.1 hypothetical protein FIV03_21435 [Labrenzia sp. THAF187b]